MQESENLSVMDQLNQRVTELLNKYIAREDEINSLEEKLTLLQEKYDEQTQLLEVTRDENIALNANIEELTKDIEEILN